jgi:putative IMPACT (imprinted ancient) family translation regulator
MIKTKQARLEISDNIVGENEHILESNYNNKIHFFTIGFTKKNLKEFIKLLRKNHIEKIIDIT